MKKLFYIIISVLVFSIYLIGKDIPVRPEGVPVSAKWNENFKYWSTDGNMKTFKIWYANGNLKVDQIIIKDKYIKIIRYHDNHLIKTIGQCILLENKFRKDDSRYEWRDYGKWKRFNLNGKLMNESCYTQVFDSEDGYWKAEYCGEEIKYNDDGTVKEKIQHKRKCDYGCEELECKDCIKK